MVMTSGIVKFFVNFLRTTGAGLLAPHRAVLIEDVIDPLDDGIRQIIVVFYLMAVQVELTVCCICFHTEDVLPPVPLQAVLMT